MKRKPLVAGNWKMHGLRASLAEVERITAYAQRAPSVDVLICPPATLLHAAREVASGSALAIGGQDCHASEAGAHTGDISAAMLKDAGADYVIVGHSERRSDHGETDAHIQVKATRALSEGLKVIVCVGESLKHRETGQAGAVVRGQLAGSLPSLFQEDDLVIAYEPIWAIGTGRTAGVEDVSAMHSDIRAALGDLRDVDPDRVRILYGGSVKPDNAGALFALDDVDGALVGGASLTASSFNAIINAASRP